MPEYLRALVAVLVLSVPVFWFLRKPLTAVAIEPGDYRLRVGLWFFVTLALFLAHSFWLFVAVVGVVLLTVGRLDSNPIGLYLFLMLVAPPFRAPIEGFGGINRFIDIDYLRLLSLVVLLPTALRLAFQRDNPGVFRLPGDKYVIGYLVLQAAILSEVTTTTNVFRTALSYVIDAWLPYYVMSRGLSDARRMRDAFASFTAGCAAIGMIAVFEAGKGWLLYSSLPSILDVHWSYGSYMYRSASLRAIGTTGHSIILGYAMTAALGLHLSLRPVYERSATWLAVGLLLTAAIGASLARGPWVGAAALLLTAAALAPNSKALLGRTALAAAFVLPLLMLTPMADRLISLLPFVGSYDEGSVDYRQQLYTVSMKVIMMNPLLGTPNYLATGALESLRQGEGIIDIVNTYLGVALFSGFIGLGLFVGVFVSGGLRIARKLLRDIDKNSELHRTGRCLLATMVGIMLIIATVSFENAIPYIYWCVAGFFGAYLQRVQLEEAPEAQPRVDDAEAAAGWA